MLTLVLAESELEMIPQEILRHPAIVSYAQQREKEPARIVLDSNVHHRAMEHLPEGRRRGRPDIVHLFLLTALESVVNKSGQLNILIHTRHNDVITVSPETRIMRSDDRFIGLIEQLFEHQVVPKETHPLLKLRHHMTLPQVVEDATADHIITCSKTGKTTCLPTYFKDLQQRQPHHIVCIVGGFPSGSFQTDVTAISDDVISMYKEMLPAWTVASEILVNYENVFL